MMGNDQCEADATEAHPAQDDLLHVSILGSMIPSRIWGILGEPRLPFLKLVLKARSRAQHRRITRLLAKARLQADCALGSLHWIGGIMRDRSALYDARGWHSWSASTNLTAPSRGTVRALE